MSDYMWADIVFFLRLLGLALLGGVMGYLWGRGSRERDR